MKKGSKNSLIITNVYFSEILESRQIKIQRDIQNFKSAPKKEDGTQELTN